ncbi:LL-diaminopimelate aminotransferase [Desulfovibrio sp. OttesenSCG-928-A18]|nr:LL-diaminopimelate aminotransferase [Desulfovibrio sp. OttesenSCG-928-A18]
MARLNSHYAALHGSYLFSEIAGRIQSHTVANPGRKLIRLGIGDVTQPLVPAVVAALSMAVTEQGTPEGFRGYGPEQGYGFLREAIARSCYDGLGISPDDIFVSDGAKCDIGNFQEVFSRSCRVAITDPVYPVYADSNVMAGRAGRMQKNGRYAKLIYLPCTAENGFIPELPGERPDIIYLCSPNNPTGTALRREHLARWVAYAREREAVILFDAAYEGYIRSKDVPHSIYEIEGADEVAVEFRSYSKSAGFTGLRCGFAVIPASARGKGAFGRHVPLREFWLRRQTTKYNGCPYIVQRAAEAVHSPKGRAQTRAAIDVYMDNAARIRQAFMDLGLAVFGGVDAPYVWVALPTGTDSWDFFDRLLREIDVVGTPGSGFGPCGQGYFRFTGFGSPEDTREAATRIKSLKV